MIFRFNTAQLERERDDALARFLDELQQANKSELDVSVVEFPKKFLVKLDDDVEMIIVWNDEKKVFAGVAEPEPVAKEEPEPDSHKDIDPMKLALLKYELMSTHLSMSVEKKIIFAKEYARLWSEHR